MINYSKNNKKYIEYYLKKYFPRIKDAVFLIPNKENFDNFYIRVYDDKRLNYFKSEQAKYKSLKIWYYRYQQNKLHYKY